MKKLFVLMMSLMMTFSLAACGGDDAESSNTTSDAVVENDGVVEEVNTTVEETADTETEVYYLSVGDFAQLPMIDMVDLSGTRWVWAGGSVDGEELTEEEFLECLEAYGGKNELVFAEDGETVQMVQGAGVAEGTCTYVETGMGITLDINGTATEYVALLSEYEDVSVLLFMPEETMAYYYLLVE